MKSTILLFLALLCLLQMTLALRIGSFNIQGFGHKKLKDKFVLPILIKIIKRYDIVLLQEIRDSTQTLLPDLKRKLNYRTSIKYDYVISDILGRSTYKEQYAFVYRTKEHISVLANYTYNDGKEEDHTDLFSREPFVAKFNVPCTEFKEIALVGVHIAPEEAVEEIKLLQKVRDSVSRKLSTSNIILMGDMNADCDFFPASKWQEVPMRMSPNYLWPICDDMDTTVKTSTHCSYDRFIIGGRSLRKSYIPGYARAYRFDEVFKLSEEKALKVSDHYPVEFVLKEDCSAWGSNGDKIIG